LNHFVSENLRVGSFKFVDESFNQELLIHDSHIVWQWNTGPLMIFLGSFHTWKSATRSEPKFTFW